MTFFWVSKYFKLIVPSWIFLYHLSAAFTAERKDFCILPFSSHLLLCRRRILSPQWPVPLKNGSQRRKRKKSPSTAQDNFYDAYLGFNNFKFKFKQVPQSTTFGNTILASSFKNIFLVRKIGDLSLKTAKTSPPPQPSKCGS